MSNSDKFEQDDAIVAAEPEVQGVLAGDDGEGAGDESVANNKIGQGEFPDPLYTAPAFSAKTPTTRRRRRHATSPAVLSITSKLGADISRSPLVPL